MPIRDPKADTTGICSEKVHDALMLTFSNSLTKV
jgi:hypothetical protein